MIESISNYTWAIPLRYKNSQTITENFSNILSSSKRSLLKLENDRGKEWYNSIFQSFLKVKNIQQYSRYTDNGPSDVERMTRSVRNFLKKPVFEKGNADWLSELPSVIKKYNNTNHSSIKKTPYRASKKSNEKVVYKSLKDIRETRNPKFNLGDLDRTADIKRVFSKGDSTSWSTKSYKIPEIICETIPTYRTDYLPERYIENFLRSTNLTLDENNQVMKKLNLIQKFNKYEMELSEDGIILKNAKQCKHCSRITILPYEYEFACISCEYNVI